MSAQYRLRCREARPLTQCITNYVSMDIMANACLAIGASPAMVHALEEVVDFGALASALVINVGTLTPSWVASMKAAAATAVSLGKTWVLDPVGCGATPYRTQACLDLLRLRPTVVRGNASEILALAGVARGATRGVDGTAAAGDALGAARALAAEHGCVVAVSGAEDLVTDASGAVLRVKNGVPMLQAITATGCAVTAMIAAYVSSSPGEPLAATAHALAHFG